MFNQTFLKNCKLEKKKNSPETFNVKLTPETVLYKTLVSKIAFFLF